MANPKSTSAKKTSKPADFIMLSVSAVYNLLLPGFCACCFWLEKSANGPKFDIGIRATALNAVDRLTKVKVTMYMAANEGRLPEAFNLPGRFEEITGLTWRNFSVDIPELNLGMRATPDFVVRNIETREIHFFDFKQSTKTEGISYYRCQTEAERIIAHRTGMGHIGEGRIIFTVPREEGHISPADNQGVDIREDFKVFPTKMEDGEVLELASRAASILRQATPPASNCKCNRCANIAKMIPHFQARKQEVPVEIEISDIAYDPASARGSVMPEIVVPEHRGSVMPEQNETAAISNAG